MTTSNRHHRSAARRRAWFAATLAVVGGAAIWQLSGPLESALGLGGAGSTAASAPGAAPTAVATDVDPELQRRFDEARAAAAAEGVKLVVTSGWRSATDQQELVDSALARYGSAEEAHRWVLPPEQSSHVQGRALDVGYTDGALWLGERGRDFGLCQTYANEMWHFEMADADGVCPEPHPDSSWGW